MKNDVSGQWCGEYLYNKIFPSTPVAVTLHEQNGQVSGTATEPRLDVIDLTTVDVASTIKGDRAGDELTFTKVYLPQENYTDVVNYYRGTVSDDGRVIEGTWRNHMLHGDFRLVRVPD